jgi:hypothetical protein
MRFESCMFQTTILVSHYAAETRRKTVCYYSMRHNGKSTAHGESVWECFRPAAEDNEGVRATW